MTWLFIMTKSGAVFAFDSEKVSFSEKMKLTYQDGYFIADGYVSLEGHNSFKKATNITIYHNEISSHWNEDSLF